MTPRTLSSLPLENRDPLHQRLTLLLLGDSWRHDVLRTLARTESRAWITGGFVRNRIWDELEPARPSTVLDDVDVVLFQGEAQAEIERELLARLKAALPSIP